MISTPNNSAEPISGTISADLNPAARVAPRNGKSCARRDMRNLDRHFAFGDLAQKTVGPFYLHLADRGDKIRIEAMCLGEIETHPAQPRTYRLHRHLLPSVRPNASTIVASTSLRFERYGKREADFLERPQFATELCKVAAFAPQPSVRVWRRNPVIATPCD